MLLAKAWVWVVVWMACSAAWADDPAGKQKASTCQACHGPAGISANDRWPNLANQKKDYLIQQLHFFRDGGRSDPMMSPVAKMLSDRDIEDLASYYSERAN